MEQNNTKYELRSEEVQELLGNVPAWIIRWGTFIVFVILISLFMLSSYLSYPDIINSKITLTADIPPAEVKSNTDGTIGEILVKEHELVGQGQVIAVIKSAADYKDVCWLKNALQDSFLVEAVSRQPFKNKKLRLGKIQTSYANYVSNLEDYQGFIDVDYYKKTALGIHAEIRTHQQFIRDLEEGRLVLEEEYKLNKSKFMRDSLLAVQGVLSKQDLEETKEEKLTSLYNLTYQKSEKSEAMIEVAQLEQKLLEMDLQLKKENQSMYSSLKASFETLKGEIAKWEKDYLITSPFTGKVSMSKIWSANQYVNEGEVVVTVIPKDFNTIVGRVSLKPQGAGKIKIANRVIIRFENFPYLEYGIVTGKISTMSLTPESGYYYATIQLDSSQLVTNYNKYLNFSQGMSGTAEIITENRNLLQRILSPLRSATKIQQMYKETEN